MAGIDAENAEICAYKFTVESLVCIERASKDLAGAKLRQGPRMRAADGTTVTPDMTLEAAEGRGRVGYRAVCEIKSSFPQYSTAVDQMVRQVQHYDGELAGWEDEAEPDGRRGGDHDIVIVVRHIHASSFTAGLPAALKERDAEIKSPLSVLGIIHKEGNGDVDQFFLKRTSGSMSHKKMHTTLGRGWSIDTHSMVKELDSTKFYDSRPPLPYVMSVLWIYVFPRLVHDKKLKRLQMNTEISIDVEVGRIHRLVSRLAPASNPGCVKRAWIKDSMEEFVRIGLAEKSDRDKYRIRYLAHEPRPAEWFARMTAGSAGNTDGPNRNQK